MHCAVALDRKGTHRLGSSNRQTQGALSEADKQRDNHHEEVHSGGARRSGCGACWVGKAGCGSRLAGAEHVLQRVYCMFSCDQAAAEPAAGQL